MKNIHLFFILIFLTFSTLIFSCKKEVPREETIASDVFAETEIDAEKIGNSLGLQFKILKTETHGYMPLHKFYWVSLKEKTDPEKTKALAKEIINAAIEKKLATYHSFTIHFFYEDEMTERPSHSNPFAQASFLPKGGWLKVGRVPIDDYKNYKLTCTFFE